MSYFSQILELGIDHSFGISVDRWDPHYLGAIIQELVSVDEINLILSAIHEVNEPFRVSLLIFEGYEI